MLNVECRMNDAFVNVLEIIFGKKYATLEAKPTYAKWILIRGHRFNCCWTNNSEYSNRMINVLFVLSRKLRLCVGCRRNEKKSIHIFDMRYAFAGDLLHILFLESKMEWFWYEWQEGEERKKEKQIMFINTEYRMQLSFKQPFDFHFILFTFIHVIIETGVLTTYPEVLTNGGFHWFYFFCTLVPKPSNSIQFNFDSHNEMSIVLDVPNVLRKSLFKRNTYPKLLTRPS